MTDDRPAELFWLLTARQRHREVNSRSRNWDIHYNARAGCKDFAPTDKLPYALVISVHAKHLGDLYDQIVRKYAGQLEVLRPIFDIPIIV